MKTALNFVMNIKLFSSCSDLDDGLKYELIIRLHSLLTRYLASYCISSTVHEKYSHTDYFKYIESIPYLNRVCMTMF